MSTAQAQAHNILWVNVDFLSCHFESSHHFYTPIRLSWLFSFCFCFFAFIHHRFVYWRWIMLNMHATKWEHHGSTRTQAKKWERKNKKEILTTHWNWMRNHHSFCIISNVCVMRKLQFTLSAFYHFASNTHYIYFNGAIIYWHTMCTSTAKVHRKWLRFYFYVHNTWHWHTLTYTKHEKLQKQKHICVLYFCTQW